jgi:hypothetical protein
MIHYPSETEARQAVARVMKQYPEAWIDEIHVDKREHRTWYIFITAPTERHQVLLRCTWSSPIIKFK